MASCLVTPQSSKLSTKVSLFKLPSSFFLESLWNTTTPSEMLLYLDRRHPVSYKRRIICFSTPSLYNPWQPLRQLLKIQSIGHNPWFLVGKIEPICLLLKRSWFWCDTEVGTMKIVQWVDSENIPIDFLTCKGKNCWNAHFPTICPSSVTLLQVVCVVHLNYRKMMRGGGKTHHMKVEMCLPSSFYNPSGTVGGCIVWTTH